MKYNPQIHHRRSIRLKGYDYSQPGQLQRQPHSLSSFVAGFKAAVTRQLNQWRSNHSIPIWQRNYYESIIRDEQGLNQVREYIQNNPLSWEEDVDNPKCNSEFQKYDLDLMF